MKDWKVLLALFVALSFLLLPAVSALNWKFDESKVHFYMYGMSTCPHCRRMKQLIPEAYGMDRFTYYELNGNQHNGRVFGNISRLTGITGVPAIGIVYDGQLVAVIEGEYNVSATPEIVRAAVENNGTLLFVGGRTYLLPHNSTESLNVVKKLYYLFVEAGEPAQLTTSSSSESTSSTKGKSGICGPAAIVGLAVIPLLLRRRR